MLPFSLHPHQNTTPKSRLDFGVVVSAYGNAGLYLTDSGREAPSHARRKGRHLVT
ncbi:hypothetical protein CABS01_16451 [Colletotrichum abscissum]|uniref:uncharacterized protein n=1 Tax=Colletotrichum abscissum TaxID=1671311 RepID=UPI0027D72D4D|nr:uncharacterized protein CABS01_16451 [Colletotrichum abscissum]KAK1471189.1 hypothetical protein CABS01_16451 [Colletotrichum abscissum]